MRTPRVLLMEHDCKYQRSKRHARLAPKPEIMATRRKRSLCRPQCSAAKRHVTFRQPGEMLTIFSYKTSTPATAFIVTFTPSTYT